MENKNNNHDLICKKKDRPILVKEKQIVYVDRPVIVEKKVIEYVEKPIICKEKEIIYIDKPVIVEKAAETRIEYIDKPIAIKESDKKVQILLCVLLGLQILGTFLNMFLK